MVITTAPTEAMKMLRVPPSNATKENFNARMGNNVWWTDGDVMEILTAETKVTRLSVELYPVLQVNLHARTV